MVIPVKNPAGVEKGFLGFFLIKVHEIIHLPWSNLRGHHESYQDDNGNTGDEIHFWERAMPWKREAVSLLL